LKYIYHRVLSLYTFKQIFAARNTFGLTQHQSLPHESLAHISHFGELTKCHKPVRGPAVATAPTIAASRRPQPVKEPLGTSMVLMIHLRSPRPMKGLQMTFMGLVVCVAVAQTLHSAGFAYIGQFSS